MMMCVVSLPAPSAAQEEGSAVHTESYACSQSGKTLLLLLLWRLRQLPMLPVLLGWLLLKLSALLLCRLTGLVMLLGLLITSKEPLLRLREVLVLLVLLRSATKMCGGDMAYVGSAAVPVVLHGTGQPVTPYEVGCQCWRGGLQHQCNQAESLVLLLLSEQ
jgi:hypothetical protein